MQDSCDLCKQIGRLISYDSWSKFKRPKTNILYLNLTAPVRAPVLAHGMTFEEAHYCIKRGDIALLTRFLDPALNPHLSNQFLWTPLMLAAVEGNTAIGKVLVSRGAKIDVINEFGDCALSLAAHKGHLAFAKWLLDLGASKQCRQHGWDLNEWIKQTSGLPAERIASVLDLLRDHRSWH